MNHEGLTVRGCSIRSATADHSNSEKERNALSGTDELAMFARNLANIGQTRVRVAHNARPLSNAPLCTNEST